MRGSKIFSHAHKGAILAERSASPSCLLCVKPRFLKKNVSHWDGNPAMDQRCGGTGRMTGMLSWRAMSCLGKTDWGSEGEVVVDTSTAVSTKYFWVDTAVLARLWTGDGATQQENPFAVCPLLRGEHRLGRKENPLPAHALPGPVPLGTAVRTSPGLRCGCLHSSAH